MKKLIKLFSIPVIISASAIMAFAQKPSAELLTPSNHTLVMIDYQSQMGFAEKSITMDELRNNAAIVAGATKIFNVPVLVTTAAEKSFSGPVFPEIEALYPVDAYIDRTTMNTWEDPNAYKAIVAKNKKKIVFAGLWTSVCIVDAALSAKADGYDVYVITDASADMSREAHEMAIKRMIQQGIKPMTAMQYLLELQRDWARVETYKAVTDLIKKYGGTYGLGVQYAHEMLTH